MHWVLVVRGLELNAFGVQYLYSKSKGHDVQTTYKDHGIQKTSQNIQGVFAAIATFVKAQATC